MIYAKPSPFERSCGVPIVISESLLGDGHKQVRGVNVRRYSKIRGPRITIIINTPSV